MSSSDSNASNNEQTLSAGRPKNIAPLTAEALLDEIKRSLRDRPHLVHKRSLRPVVEQVDKCILELISNQKLQSDPEQRALVRQVLDALHVERQVYNAKLEHFETTINTQEMFKQRIADLEQQIKELEPEKKKLEKSFLNSGEQAEEGAFQKEYEFMLQYPAPQSARKSFEESFQYLLKFRHEFGHFNVRKDYLAPDGYKLGLWVESLRKVKYEFDAYGKANRTFEQSNLDRLRAIGFFFERDRLVPFENRLEQVKQYFEHKNTKRIPHDEKHLGLGKWASKICQMYCRGTLDADRKKQLEELEFDFTILKTLPCTGKRKQPPQAAEDIDSAETKGADQDSG